MLLGDEFFLVALDDRTGRSRLSSRVLGLGAAGALLGELLLEGWITVEWDRVRVLKQRPPPDSLMHATLDRLLAEPSGHSVRTWLVFLAQTATDQVADRLWRGGIVRREQARRWWRAETIYPPTDMNVAYTPTARLVATLRDGRQASWPDTLLLGLVVATGLQEHLLYHSDSSARDYLNHIIEHLTPAMHTLVWHLHAVVGDAVLTGRV